MIRVVVALALIVAVISLLHYIKRQPPQQRKKMQLQLGLGIVILIAVVAAVTGRLHWLGAFIAVLLPFLGRLFGIALRMLPFLQHFLQRRRQQQAGTMSGGNTSRVSTHILQMQLDHESGEMDGDVLEGPGKGERLSQLTEAQLLALLQYCESNDQESHQLLSAYLQRRFGEEWFQQQGAHRAASNHGGNLSETEALQILGLEPNASEAEIIQAHRRLMQKLHPDHGGTDYLAARVNQAKDVLLKQ